VDPNPFWLEDYYCSCGHDTCGADTVFTDATRDMAISNYQLVRPPLPRSSHPCNLLISLYRPSCCEKVLVFSSSSQ
jgi:hypothetical protein